MQTDGDWPTLDGLTLNRRSLLQAISEAAQDAGVDAEHMDTLSAAVCDALLDRYSLAEFGPPIPQFFKTAIRQEIQKRLPPQPSRRG